MFLPERFEIVGKYITASEAARRLGVTDKTVRSWIKHEKLSAHHVRKNQLAILESEVEQLVRERKQYEPDDPRDMVTSLRSVVSELTDRLSSLEQKVTNLEQEVDALKKAYPGSDVQASLPPVSIVPMNESTHQGKPSNRIVEPKRAYTKKKASGLPEGCTLATDFARMHGVAPTTFNDHMILGLGPGTVPGEQGDPMLPVKEQVDYSERDKPGRKGERERYLTPDQQKAALEFWRRHGVPFTMPSNEQKAPDEKPITEEAAWYLPD